MKMRTLVLLAAVALLALGLAFLGRVRGSALAQSGGPPATRYVVMQRETSGGQYRLSGRAWQVHGMADGDGYQLTVTLGPAGTGTPCCCTYVPCALRNY